MFEDIEDSLSEIQPELSITKLESNLPDDDRREKIVNFYYKNSFFVNGISNAIRILNYCDLHKDKTYNVIKTTRAGFTTNSILSALFLNKKILLVAPTNKILYDTVKKSFELYVSITGDESKYMRPIPNNKDGCSCVLKKLKDYPQLNNLPFISAEDCESCSSFKSYPHRMQKFAKLSTPNFCVTKTMLEEYDINPEAYSPDILTITYDKFMTLGSSKRSNLFKDLISKVDIIVFDEIGDFLSKSFHGYEVSTTEHDKYDNLHSRKDLDYIKTKLISTIPLIKNSSSRRILTYLYKEFIVPFIDETLIPNTKLKLPKLVINKLTQTSIEELVPLTPHISRHMRLTKQESLTKKYREYYQTLESIAMDKEDMDMINIILNLLPLMSKKQLLIYDMDSVKYSPSYIKKHSIFISSAEDNLIQKLNQWTYPDKIILFSDATMPSHNFLEYTARPIKNIFYGDPANNNKSCLIFHDPDIPQFSKSSLFKNSKYRNLIYSKLLKYLHIDTYGNTVIWSSSKDVSNDIIAFLKSNSIPTCTHDNPERSSVLVTYYGSTFTRGVESNRRYQILFGKSTKPKKSYDHIAFMRRNSWNFVTEKDLKSLSDQESIPFPEYKKYLKIWNSKTHFNDFIIMKEILPFELTTYFEFVSQSLNKETCYMNSWQAASRCKDPTGDKRSVNVCLGWTLNEVNEMLKWGSNDSISYSPISNKRLLKTNKNSISKPFVVSSRDTHQINLWFLKQDILPSHIGFNENILEGIKSYVSQHRTATTKDIWLSLCDNNLEFSDSSDKYDNGYLIGCLNAILYYGVSEDIDIYHSDEYPLNFTFTYNPSPHIPPKKSYTIIKNEFLLLLDILRSIYLIQKDEITYSDIRHAISEKKISTQILREMYSIIIDNDMFKGSTYSIKDNKIIKSTSRIMEETTLKSLPSLKKQPNTQLIISAITDWYFNSTENTIDSMEISETLPSFKGNHILITTLLSLFLKESELQKLTSNGMNIELSPQPDDNMLITRKNVIY